MGSQKKILGQNGGTFIQRLHMRCRAVLEQRILRIWIIYSMSLGVLHFVGDSLVPDTIDKNCLEGAKVPQQEIQKNLH
ncbi:uncharacterized protein LOC125868558 isoform X5 [Solanum stenotomum]|uniref:uncharacterized protein LOC125868558 isoform X5 n=1 Tax=Solanum stenotomum TaxID=172797 RepID=UPI0020D1A8C0|nr:uncharacterized protein LOC125868558 isoform X5 [Solanum stenotomum]